MRPCMAIDTRVPYRSTISEFTIPDLNNNSICSGGASNDDIAVNRDIVHVGTGYSDISVEKVFDGELIQCGSLKSGGSNNGSLVSGGGEVLSNDDGLTDGNDGNSDDVSVCEFI